MGCDHVCRSVCCCLSVLCLYVYVSFTVSISGPEPTLVTAVDWDPTTCGAAHTKGCGCNGVWSAVGLLPGGAPTELRVLPSITGSRPVGKCLTSEHVGGQPVISSSICRIGAGADAWQQRWAMSTVGGLLHLGNASSNLCLTAHLRP